MIDAIHGAIFRAPVVPPNAALPPTETPATDPKLQETFTDFVGQTFYGHLLAAMRKTVHKGELFHGGRAEEVFQGQLDQVLAERMARSGASPFAESMFQVFMLARR
jgi:hypothetical protein